MSAKTFPSLSLGLPTWLTNLLRRVRRRPASARESDPEGLRDGAFGGVKSRRRHLWVSSNTPGVP